MHEIQMPFYLYTSEVLENIELPVSPSLLKNNHMKKIELNKDIINKIFIKRIRMFLIMLNGWEYL